MYKIAVIIPCYKVAKHVLAVIEKIGPEVSKIYVVDDACPQNSGKLVEEKCLDSRVRVVYNSKNLGVGGSVKAGFSQAIEDGADILVKIDGDGQIDPAHVKKLVIPLQKGHADYVKGNRFFNHKGIKGMPLVRLLGNSALSFLTKLSSGYWHIMDPTNGLLAIHAKVFKSLEYDKIDNRFFFETDMLFRLHLLCAVVQDVPMQAHYGDEESNLRIHSALFNFARKHCSRLFKRTIYEYFLQDFNAGSTQLASAILLISIGFVSGFYWWVKGMIIDKSTETGVIMMVAILLILGFQLLLGALHFDVSNKYTKPIHPFL